MARAYPECTAGYKLLLLCATYRQCISLSAIHISSIKMCLVDKCLQSWQLNAIA